MAGTAGTTPATVITTASAPGGGGDGKGVKVARLSPRMVMTYDMIVLVILLVLAGWYLNDPTLGHWLPTAQTTQDTQPAKTTVVTTVTPAPATKADPAVVTPGFDLRKNLDLALAAMWFGALGGVVISLKSVFDHTAFTKDWDPDFGLWHLGRPYTGAIAGLMTVILLAAAGVQGAVANTAVVFAVAFIFGTQETRFFNFLYEVAKLVVQVAGDIKPTFAAAGMEPVSAAPGSLILIRGSAFEKNAVAKIAGVPLEKQAVAADGTMIAGLVPPRPATVAANTAVEITVTQGPLTVTAAGPFRYSA